MDEWKPYFSVMSPRTKPKVTETFQQTVFKCIVSSLQLAMKRWALRTGVAPQDEGSINLECGISLVTSDYC